MTKTKFLGAFQSGCVPYNSQSRTPYGYEPSLGVAIAFLVLFATSLAFHLYRGIKFRRITSIFFTTAACVGCVGWSGRIWSTSCPYNRIPFTLQILAFTLTPSFILLGILLILRLYMLQNTKGSKLLSANSCFFILATLIAISTTLQFVGVILTIHDLKTTETIGMGPTLSIAGHILQIYTLLITSLFLLLHSLQKTQPKALLEIGELPVLITTSLSTLALLINSIYHIAVDIQGWRDSIYSNQGYFIGFDAILIFVALASFNIFDPAVMLGHQFYHLVDTGMSAQMARRRSTPKIIVHRGTNFEIVGPKLVV